MDRDNLHEAINIFFRLIENQKLIEEQKQKANAKGYYLECPHCHQKVALDISLSFDLREVA